MVVDDQRANVPAGGSARRRDAALHHNTDPRQDDDLQRDDGRLCCSVLRHEGFVLHRAQEHDLEEDYIRQ